MLNFILLLVPSLMLTVALYLFVRDLIRAVKSSAAARIYMILFVIALLIMIAFVVIFIAAVFLISFRQFI